MKRQYLMTALGLSLASCTASTTSERGDVEKARAQLIALADNPAAARFEGLDPAPAPGDAICGRLVDSGVPNSPVRYFLEPVGKRVLLDPQSTLPAENAETAINRCKQLRRDRSASHESIEAVCRPAEVLQREARLRRSFDKRSGEVCGRGQSGG